MGRWLECNYASTVYTSHFQRVCERRRGESVWEGGENVTMPQATGCLSPLPCFTTHLPPGREVHNLSILFQLFCLKAEMDAK